MSRKYKLSYMFIFSSAVRTAAGYGTPEIWLVFKGLIGGSAGFNWPVYLRGSSPRLLHSITNPLN